MIKNVIFDLGGVLIDLDREEALKRFREIGVHDIDILLDPYRQTGILLDLETGRLDAEAFSQALSQRYNKTIAVKDVSYALLGFLRRVDSEKFEYIEKLRSNYKVYLLSNTNPYIHSYAESEEFLPSRKPLCHFFDHIYASYQMGCCKPDKLIFDKMLEHGKFDPSESLFIDDGPDNVAMGESLGMKTYCPKNAEDWRDKITAILEQ